ncbi:flagellar hook-associated protein FlgL [Sporosarcina sp. ACRSL]|uniref:flagellar hook-associated protein FlgL n=1 Tax=Sporosarcina sp. ACRSL TaxID=2918215 RepID=UPI001EF6713A|nr:flagellar hook-associated protein FlgL [Sporosarcina sp. ACRSL]MCG7344353.1 flagellar hook-associated protein FlgL [Sporosarcina sp. ACRSL]
MRVTQSMLSNNMLRNLSTSYNKMGKLQDQLATQKKVNRPSDDPVVAMKGMAYRMQVDKVEQYQRNLGEVHNWLDTTDDALDHVGEAMKRLQELVTDAANDTKTYDDRQKVLKEIEQLREQVRDLANTKSGENYLFSGTKTGEPLFNAEKIAGLDIPQNASEPYPTFTDYSSYEQSVTIEVFDGVELQVNTNGFELFSKIDDMFRQLTETINDEGKSGSDIGSFLGNVDTVQNLVLKERANIGARQNRAEMMDNRLYSQEVISKKQMSENEDIDIEKVITEMITQESVHRAALSVGARIIQPSLVEFLR